MAITGFELYRVMQDYMTADLLIWRRYKSRAPGMLEAMLDSNPQLAVAHRAGPFIPVGTYVRIPIDPDLMLRVPPSGGTTQIWTDRYGYRT